MAVFLILVVFGEGLRVMFVITRVFQMTIARTMPTMVQLRNTGVSFYQCLSWSFRGRRLEAHMNPIANIRATPNFFLVDSFAFIVSCSGKLIIITSIAIETMACPKANEYKLKQ